VGSKVRSRHHEEKAPHAGREAPAEPRSLYKQRSPRPRQGPKWGA